jgi:hypothetical protein
MPPRPKAGPLQTKAAKLKANPFQKTKATQRSALQGRVKLFQRDPVTNLFMLNQDKRSGNQNSKAVVAKTAELVATLIKPKERRQITATFIVEALKGIALSKMNRGKAIDMAHVVPSLSLNEIIQAHINSAGTAKDTKAALDFYDGYISSDAESNDRAKLRNNVIKMMDLSAIGQPQSDGGRCLDEPLSRQPLGRLRQHPRAGTGESAKAPRLGSTRTRSDEAGGRSIQV